VLDGAGIKLLRLVKSGACLLGAKTDRWLDSSRISKSI